MSAPVLITRSLTPCIYTSQCYFAGLNSSRQLLIAKISRRPRDVRLILVVHMVGHLLEEAEGEGVR